jgi:hypothetical protein
MFDKLGVQWACSLLAFISIPLALIPLYVRWDTALTVVGFIDTDRS